MNTVFVMGGGGPIISKKREMFYIIFVVVVLYSWSSLQICLYSSYFLWLSKKNSATSGIKPLKPEQ